MIGLGDVPQASLPHRASAAIAVLCAALTGAPAAVAQNFPSKPVRYIVTFAAGTSPDLVARMLGERYSKHWGQPVIVENRVGFGGVLGAASVAKAPPDGYTLVQCNVGSNAIAMSLNAKMPYDQVRDFAPVTRIGMMPNIVFSHPSVPARTLKELIALARANPGKLSFAAGLPGISPPLSMELLKLVAKFDIVHVPYKVASQGITDVIGGQIPFGVFNVPAIIGPVQAGRLRAIAITTAQRVPQLPDTPTVQESGIANFDVSSWYGVCAPAATPSAILDKLNADINSVLRQPETQQRLVEFVITPGPSTRAQFDAFIKEEIARWARVIKEAGIPQQ